MSVGTRVFFLVVSTGELILGVLGNGFIGLVNCIAWVKNGKVSSADFILTCLAVARTILEVLWARVLEWGWALTNHLTIWFAICLSVFYFLKIANFSHFFFMWLKWRMNRVLLVLFLAFFFLLSFDLLMQDALVNLNHSRDFSTEADKRAMKMVTTFLHLIIVYFISILIGNWIFFKLHCFPTKDDG
ncbi:PREDICTED: taste receptor type 2 member 42-like [Bison bison bison]|uniref:Taste receptor type 2 member 42-like n=1 Tax=Bison bison bison TaxID=43346 RepID=A0A6P3J090_BISBB|nr:PREDICTED: taste receptor type 2 member 42-like [Bison bison bison]